MKRLFSLTPVRLGIAIGVSVSVLTGAAVRQDVLEMEGRLQATPSAFSSTAGPAR
jgi:hypothetical protein